MTTETSQRKESPPRTLSIVGIDVDAGKPLVRRGADQHYGLKGDEMREALDARDREGNFDLGENKGRITFVHYGIQYGPHQLTLEEYDAWGEPQEVIEDRAIRPRQ